MIISDAWVPPREPSWHSFSVRVPESDCAKIPLILEKLEPNAREMGKRAAQAWEKWFSERAVFNNIVESCISIMQERKIPERYGRFLVGKGLMRPVDFRFFVLTRLKQLLL